MGNTETKQTGKWGDGVNLNWSEEGERKLRTSILEEYASDQIVLMVFGNTGSGKSSLLNGFRSAIQASDRVSSYFQVGTRTEEKSYTKSFEAVEYCRKACKEGCKSCVAYFWTVDMPGTFAGLSLENIRKIGTGEVPFYAQINETLKLEDGYETLPEPERVKASCVIIVAKCGTKFVDDVKKQISEVQRLGGAGVLSAYLILTFPDLVDPSLANPDGLPNIFRSVKVRNAVDFASKETGIPPSCIGVVRNFTEETFTDTNTHILLLFALSNIIHSAKQSLQRSESKERIKSKMYKKHAN